MAKTKISEFSSTPGSNTDIDGINIAEGCAPSGINDAIRELMAQLKDFQTGAAGDSFNGPVGTTTAAAGAFTTLSASGTTTLSGLTASTALALDASKNVVSVTNTGTGNNVLATSPTLVTPALGTPSSATLTNATGLPISTGVSGLGTGIATALAVNVGTAGAPVVNGGALGTPSSGTVTNLTGTASININGTVGATTPTTGAFTTLSASGDVTLSGGTANGVAYLNGSKVLTTGSALTFDGTNFALTGPGGIAYGSFGTSTNSTNIGADGTGSFIGTQSGGTNIRYNINGSEQMRLTSTGLGIGTSSPAFNSGSGIEIERAGVATIRLQNTNVANASGEIYNGSDGFLHVESTYSYGYGIKLNVGVGSTKATLDSSGNLGLGVTPSAWVEGTGLNVGSGRGGSIYTETVNYGFTTFNANAYYSATNTWKYVTSNPASRYQQLNGVHSWYTAPSGTAGNAISFTQAMTLDASGNLGIGTTSPSSYGKLAVGSTGSIAILGSTGSGGTTGRGLTLYNSTSTDGNNFAAASFKAAFSSSTYSSGYGYFETVDSSGTLQERARIDSSGELLVGTTTAGATPSQGFVFTPSSDSLMRIGHANGTGSGSNYVLFGYNSTNIGAIYQSGTNAVVYNTSSDYRLKDISGNLTGYKERIMALKPKQGTWKSDGAEFRGFLAHEFANQYPSLVSGEKDGVDSDGNPQYQGMQAGGSETIADLVALAQEQQAIIEQLTSRIAALETK